MSGACVVRLGVAALASLPFLVAPAVAEPLTADRAVQLALQNSTGIVNARANVLDARGSLYGAYSGVLPRFGADISRSGNLVRGNETNSFRLNADSSFGVLRIRQDSDRYATVPQVTGAWQLSLAAWSAMSSSRNGLRAATHQQAAARNDVALATRRQFYEVVRAVHAFRVNSEALQLSRDDERRVRALYEVGSVSRSDVLTAQVRTAQSELDSLLAVNQITVQRIVLSETMGIPEQELGEVDTSLTITPRTYDEAGVLADASRSRPDILAAEAGVRSANGAINAARFERLPYVTARGSVGFKTTSTSSTDPPNLFGDATQETDRNLSAVVALNWDFFDGLATDGRIASARAQLMRARETRDALRRNLTAEVRRALLGYREAIEGVNVARRAVDAATERLKLSQQKYNVGSSTILDLVDAQVQLQRAENQLVSARAAVRVAEAAVEQVRGTPQ